MLKRPKKALTDHVPLPMNVKNCAPVFDYLTGVFFGRFEKNSSSKKLKTQAKFTKTQAKIPKKLKNRQLQLSLVGGKFSNTTIFCLNCTIQYLTSDRSV